MPKEMLYRRGLMLVLSSPSGAGKTALSRGLLAREKNLTMSVSMTTRAPRRGEVDGVDYFFRSEEQFKAAIENGEFLEYAHVFGNYYGTPKGVVEENLAQGKDVLFDIDWQGTQQVAEKAVNDMVSVFVLPPSLEVLETRLTKRAQDSQEVVRTRMSKACDEMSHWSEYDYIIVNDDLDESIGKLHGILAAERLRRDRLEGLADFVNDMRNP
ncbi:MAG: guanylate kinase [Alphaproteobacteria bacterium]|nr:guanylate kinase [Alphaproteobacteria bacterium]